MWSFRIAMLAVVAAASYTQTSFFELALPDLNQTLSGTSVLAELPRLPLTRMTIQLLGSADKNLNHGDLRVRINGKGVRNVFDSGSNDRGKFLAMNPSTLRMRPDQIFDARENTVEVYGKDRRGRAYYQNWILRMGDENANPYFSYVSSRSPGDESGVPPDLTLEQPALPVHFTAAGASVTVHVKGSASASSGITSLTFNGKPAAKAGRGLSISFDESVSVARGVKALAVEAADKNGNRRTIKIPVIYPVDNAPRVRMSGQSVALIIGISHFTAKTGAPPPLPAAAYEATQLAAELENRGFRKENIRLLLDERATAEQVRTALGDFTATAKPEDFLLVYIATQGLHDPTAPEKVFLAASDSQVSRLGDTAIEITDLQLLLNRAIRSRHALLFFDAEHPLGDDFSFQGKPIVNTYLLNLFDGPLGRSVLVSGSAGQESQESSVGGVTRSLFSSALTEGLSGKADVDRNHVVTAREICAYVSETVRRASGGKQSPQYRYSDTEAESPVLALR